MGIRKVVEQVLGWIRAGYPDGVPRQDHVALLGVLRHRLSEAEIEAVARGFIAAHDHDVQEEEIRERISSLSRQSASDEDVRRVSAVLAAAGWPLALVEADEDSAAESASESVGADPDEAPAAEPSASGLA